MLQQSERGEPQLAQHQAHTLHMFVYTLTNHPSNKRANAGHTQVWFLGVAGLILPSPCKTRMHHMRRSAV